MAYDNQQQQRPAAQAKTALTAEQAESIAKLTRREGYLEFTADDILLMWDTAPAPCLMVDFKRFVYMASAKHLNPILNDIHLEYRYSSDGPKASIVVHQDGLLKIATRSNLLDGITQSQGKDERDWYVETTVHKKDCAQPFVFRAYYGEFVGTKQGGAPNYMWAKMPYNMTAKCSRAGALRLAFPEECSGIMAEEEIHDDEAPDERRSQPDQPYAIGEKKAEAPPPPVTPAGPAMAAAAPAPATVAASPELLRAHEEALAPATSGSRREPEPPATAASVAPAPAAVDPASQFKARRKMIVTSPVWQIGMEELNQVMLGYFGVSKLAEVPRDPDKCLVLLDDVIAYLGERGPGELKADPKKFGQYRRMILTGEPLAAAEPEPAAAPAPAAADAAVTLFAQIKEKHPGWKDDLCAIAAKLVEVRMEGSLPDLEAMIGTPILAKFTEPMLETAFLICYYGVECLTAVLQNFQRTKMPLSWFQNEIQKHAGGPLAGFALDPKKVMEAVSRTLADPAVR